jgi:hypothetical protein
MKLKSRALSSAFLCIIIAFSAKIFMKGDRYER